jgi:outer membrane receptor for ferrienterochelin and colicins
MGKIRLTLLSILVFQLFGLAQNSGSKCEVFYNEAEEKYNIGDFETSFEVLKQYETCTAGKDWKYDKLQAKILIGQEELNQAKKAIVRYVKKKKENVISENDPQLFKDFCKQINDSIKRHIADSIANNIVHRDTIFSVSKTPEILSETPATIIIIKQNEIFEKGYVDIVDVLSNLPGFDISKVYGATYSNVFQRGFRQENTERTLFMIDGVEENDIWSNIAYISRQYPIANIKAIEVIYGPSSTIYGARAFVGAINIITKSYEDIKNGTSFSVADSAMTFNIIGSLVGGQNNTQGADLTLAGKHRRFSFTLTGKMYKSDEHDFSRQSHYNYDVDDFDNYPVSSNLSVTDNAATTDVNELQEFITKIGSVESHAGYQYSDSTKTKVILTADGVAYARQKDKEAYLGTVNGSEIKQSNATDNWYVGGAVKTGNVEFGFRSWKRKEGFNYYQDLFAAGSDNGSNWAPINSTFYTKYSQKLGNWNLSNLASYKIHSLSKESVFVRFQSYAIGAGNIANLYSGDDAAHGWKNVHYYYIGQQFRNDTKLSYSKGRVKFLTGLEFRNSQLQGNYRTHSYFATEEAISEDLITEESALGSAVEGGNQFNVNDFSIYSQLSYRLLGDFLQATVGGRYDYNQIRKTGGFGSLFSPKVALIANFKPAVAKLIYSQGLQNPSQWTTYSTAGSRLANPDLIPEKIQNIELTLMSPDEQSSFQWLANTYYSLITDAISLAADPDNPGTSKHQNNGTYGIIGAQLLLKYKLTNKLSLDFNTTYTNAKETVTDQLIGDIASFRANAGATYRMKFHKNRFTVNILGNFVGARPVGENTTVPANEGIDGSGEIPQYFTMHSTLSYWNENYANIRLQLTVNNLLDQDYFHPGQRTANANSTTVIAGHNPWVVQPGRYAFVKLTLGL